MLISINDVSLKTSVMLGPKKIGNPKCYDCKNQTKKTKTQVEGREKEPNPSKDRAIPMKFKHMETMNSEAF
jgi:hypothetical protein